MAPSILSGNIEVEGGFQTSVNIAYDLNNNDKIRSFIPTNASLRIIEDILLSTFESSTDRARILIGAYGKGKSHIILETLALLSNKDEAIFEELFKHLKNYKYELYEFAQEYVRSDKKLIPVIIQGSNASLTQSFLSALKIALEANDLSDLMPETHFQAAIKMISKWQTDYPETYTRFEGLLNEPVQEFVQLLAGFNIIAYDHFEKVYPSLTSGSAFNPFLGFDVVELYAKVVERLVERGYSGLYIIYDEFSKYLESSIIKASVVDIKMLQDFAERCNRSKAKQMHLLLISHKDISNYIDKLPKQKVDGWKGVSERFTHVEMHNNFSQVYELISAVIKKNEDFFKEYTNEHLTRFLAMRQHYSPKELFAELDSENIDTVIYGCYPLSPVATFVLPRLSEKIAQNERTLFTFLSAISRNTLHAFIEGAKGDFPILTPDFIYDYFEPLLRKEVYTSETHKLYTLTTGILSKLEPDSLGTKIVKTIALIYIVGQFEKLPPLPDVVTQIFVDASYDMKEISTTLKDLQDNQYVIYMRRSNHFLKLKNSQSAEVGKQIADHLDKNSSEYNLINILNNATFENYMYPTRYNDENEITRYFTFTFIKSSVLFEHEPKYQDLMDSHSSGMVFGIILAEEDDIDIIKERLMDVVYQHPRILFVVPNVYTEISKMAYEYESVKCLKQENLSRGIHADESLTEEYDIYLEDLEEVLHSYISGYNKPEMRKASYYYMGRKLPIFRKAQISERLSQICRDIYPHTPVINNEAINKDGLPAVAINSRSKVIAGLLGNELLFNLGLSGTGQEISIMRSTLVMTGILTQHMNKPVLTIAGNQNVNMEYVLTTIVDFIRKTSNNNPMRFSELYEELISPDYGIGLKRGVIPIYLAVVLHQLKQYAVITNGARECEITASLLNSINEQPHLFSICLEDWNDEKAEYIRGLEEIFVEYVVEHEKDFNTFTYIVKAMQRWFIGLPKFAKEIKQIYLGNGNMRKIETEKARVINSLKQPDINAREYLFERVFSMYNLPTFTVAILDNIKGIKTLLDNSKHSLIDVLIEDVRDIFDYRKIKNASLYSVIKDWKESLSEKTFSHLFHNNEQRVIELLSTITHDERTFIERLAKAITGLRIDDWNDQTVFTFLDELKTFKSSVEEFSGANEVDGNQEVGQYKLSFKNGQGQETSKTFSKIEYSDKAILLLNEISTAIDEMGQSISQQEKRQVLIELLQKLC